MGDFANLDGMGQIPRGRPRVSSRATFADAACELFLEKGYEATSITELARRVGVSRSSFFNYFDSKADIFWGGLDKRITAFEKALAADPTPDAVADVTALVRELLADFVPDSLALAILNKAAMGVIEVLEHDGAVRQVRIARAVSARLCRGGADQFTADIVAAAWAGAVMAGINAWAHNGAGSNTLADAVERASAILDRLTPLLDGTETA